MSGDEPKTGIPKQAIFDWEDRLRKKLDELDTVMRNIRNELLGACPPSKVPVETGKERESNPGFFSGMQYRLTMDAGIVDEIMEIAHEVQRSLGNPEPERPTVVGG
jgi:hypothetical protein